MASRKLTALPTATEVTTSDKIYIVDVSDTSESPQGTSKQAVISELPSSGITTLTSTDGSISIDLTDPSAPDLSVGYRSYVALLTQSGTSAPTAIVLKNNTGLTWTFDYVDVGDYDALPSVAPSDDNKVLVFGGDGTGDITKMRWRSGSAKIETKNSSFVGDNGRLSNTPIEIRIYP